MSNEPQYIYVINGVIDNVNFSPRVERYELEKETPRYLILKCRSGTIKKVKQAHGFKFARTEEELQRKLKSAKEHTLKFLRTRIKKIEEMDSTSIHEVPAERPSYEDNIRV